MGRTLLLPLWTTIEVVWKRVRRIIMPTFQSEPIGYLILSDRVKICVYEPISKFHRFMMKLCFGWTYEPYQKGGK